MPSPRSKPTFPGTVHTATRARRGQPNMVRMPRSQLLLRVKDQDPEMAGWAKEGWITAAVMADGDLAHLQSLAAMGARFEKLSWSNPDRMAQWTQTQTRQWLTVLFDHGWDGHTGNPEVLLSVAEYHPGLIGMWHSRAPKAWQTRQEWLSGKLVLFPGLDQRYILSSLGVGASLPTANRSGLESWIAQTNKEDVDAALRGIAAFMRQDKQRRRVRGEPPFRDWPWEDTIQAALKASRVDILHTLVELRGPLTAEQSIELVCQSPKACEMLDRVRELEWKLPAPGARLAGRFLSRAIVAQQAIAQGPSEREALALRLMEEGYTGPLELEALRYVNGPKASAPLGAAWQHAQLQRASQSPAAFAPSRPRQRL